MTEHKTIGLRAAFTWEGSILILLALLFIQTAEAQELTPKQILKRIDTVMFPDNFIMKFSLATASPGKAESKMVLSTRHKKDVGTIMEITWPERSKGVRFLQKANTLWMYNPKAKSQNAVRLSPKSSFQGSVFSNNDIGDTEFSDDYDTTRLADEMLKSPELGSVECYVIEGKAKSPGTTYARIKAWCRTADCLPLRIEYYTKSGMLFKSMTLGNLKMLAGRIRPSTIAMESYEQAGTVSTISIEEMKQADNLRDGDFTQAALTR
jgi:hypothetical protein